MKSKAGKVRLALAATAAGGLVAGLLAAPPASADPVSLTLKYNCTFPLIGEQVVTAAIKSDIPKSVPVNTPIPKIIIDVTSTQNEDTWSGLNLVGATTLEGTATANSTVIAPQGNVAVKVPVILDKTTLPVSDTPVPFDLHGSGQAPAIRFSKAGHAKITVGDLKLNITPRDSDGNEVEIPDPTADIHNVACTLVPGQNTSLAEFDITAAGSAPTKPGTPTGTTTKDSATLTWGASTDADGDLAGYDVYGADGKVVASTNATTTSATISGLSADTDYTYTVKAKDAAGRTSDASDAVTVHTQKGAPQASAPTKPGTPTGTTTENSATLTWGASTDADGDLAGYDVYSGATKVASTGADATTATISGLSADTDYTYTVKARDAAGHESDASDAVTVHTEQAQPVDHPPTKPGAPSGTTTENTATVSWGASSDEDGDLAGYDVYGADGKVVASTDAATTTATIAGLTADTDYTFTVKAKDAKGNASAASDAVTLHTEKGQEPEGTAPTAPGKPAGTATQDSVALSWAASTDADGDLAGYDVYRGDQVVASTGATETTATITGLDADTDYTFTVQAKDAKGHVSEASPAGTVRTQPKPVEQHAPTAPGNLAAGTATKNSVPLTWTAATDQDGDLAGYEVYGADGKVVATAGADATGVSVTGLAADTDYAFTVKAKDAKGNLSAAAGPVAAHTAKDEGGTVSYGYTLKGSTFVKTPNGTAPLNGSINANLKLSTGEFTADLALDPTKGDFKLLGFLPAQAQIQLVPQGKTTGRLDPTTKILTSHSQVIAKLPSFTLFGIPLGGGDQCQTAKPSDITLTSTGVFAPTKGGDVKGAYDLSAIQNCGALTPLLSAFTAGKGNTITATLTPKK
ncbi:fibronectin type III domain-containing protein [Actinomadura parmotrematis]|uniref:fibronectin type III domain-containing protein n=1 Tax=Actinomadura parmotrematis TaxID=2864039 RepID=UPI0027E2560F|nr:fibronectin type III domain-containing protein [Actinomadura parmotrematis]